MVLATTAVPPTHDRLALRQRQMHYGYCSLCACCPCDRYPSYLALFIRLFAIANVQKKVRNPRHACVWHFIIRVIRAYSKINPTFWGPFLGIKNCRPRGPFFQDFRYFRVHFWGPRLLRKPYLLHGKIKIFGPFWAPELGPPETLFFMFFLYSSRDIR